MHIAGPLAGSARYNLWSTFNNRSHPSVWESRYARANSLGFDTSEQPAAHQSHQNTQSTHHPTPDLSGGLRDIIFLTAQPNPHLIVRAPHHHSFQPKLFQITQPGSIRNFQPIIGSHHPAGVHLEFLTKTSSKSPSQGPIINSPGKLHLTP